MGKTTILIKLEEKYIRDIFKEYKSACNKFYKEWYDPKDAEIDAMEIRGRLDFIDEISADEFEILMQDYKQSVVSGEIEAMYLEYKDSLHGHGELANAIIQVAMYGQMTIVNQDLFDRLKDMLLINYSLIFLDMIYESYSSLNRGSKTNIGLPLVYIQQGPEDSILIVNPEASQLPSLERLESKIDLIEPKTDTTEYFKIGKHPKLSGK